MKKMIILICVLSFGCVQHKIMRYEIESTKRPIFIKNLYYDNIKSVRSTTCEPLEFIPVDEGILMDAATQNITVTFITDNNCFLYKYNTEQLMEMKLNGGYAADSWDAVFVLDPKGLKVIPRAKYRELFFAERTITQIKTDACVVYDNKSCMNDLL